MEIQRTENKHLKDLEDWKRNKKSYVDSHIKDKKLEYISASKYCIRPSIILLCVAVMTPIIVRYYSEIKTYIESKGYSEYNLMGLIVILALFAGFELLFRTYLADKDRVKMGLHWIGTFGLSKKKAKLLENYQEQFNAEYNQLHREPNLQSIH